MLCLVKCDEGRFSSSVFTSWRKPYQISEVQVRVLLLLTEANNTSVLKFKSSLCWQISMSCFKVRKEYVPLVLNFFVIIILLFLFYYYYYYYYYYYLIQLYNTLLYILYLPTKTGFVSL